MNVVAINQAISIILKGDRTPKYKFQRDKNPAPNTAVAKAQHLLILI